MKIKKDLVLRRIGSEYIIIVPDVNVVDMTDVYTLNETSAWIWEQVRDKSFTVEEIVELVQQEYDVDKETAQKDVSALIDILREGKLITED